MGADIDDLIAMYRSHIEDGCKGAEGEGYLCEDSLLEIHEIEEAIKSVTEMIHSNVPSDS